MIPTRRALIASGLCLASALSLTGCAADRQTQTTNGWSRIWSPFRSARVAENEPAAPNADSSGIAAAPAAPSAEWQPSAPADEYYTPRRVPTPNPGRALAPPQAPPHAEPGYLSDDNNEATETTTGLKSQPGRPARLRDVFDNFGRKTQDNPRPAIPLDEPVASQLRHDAARVVGFEQVEPVTLGMPEFDAAE